MFVSTTRCRVGKEYSSTFRECTWFFFSSRRRHTRFDCDWSSDVCSSDLASCAYCLPVVRCCLPSKHSLELHIRIQYSSHNLTACTFNNEWIELILEQMTNFRSEERRVGKEGRSRWSPDH